LSSCNNRLQRVFNEVIKHWDCTIVCGHRGEIAQNRAFFDKKSKVRYPDSKHNTFLSEGIDVAPYYPTTPHIRWNNTREFYAFAGFVLGIAASMRIKLRWGGDWDSDKDLTDQKFNDLLHFETVD
jgi:peptidoglycan L-alanyl-D-glutamate endopeptidase CwlK